MKIRNFVGIALLLILSLIYTWYEANRPRPVDWSETYSPKDKIPYGTYITYRSLPELFPDSKIRTSRSASQQRALTANPHNHNAFYTLFHDTTSCLPMALTPHSPTHTPQPTH